VLRYLEAWREAVVQQLAEGASLVPQADASAMKTSEMVAKAQLIKDILALEARDIANFYGLAEPNDEPGGKKS
jgi:hypothetical protein